MGQDFCGRRMRCFIILFLCNFSIGVRGKRDGVYGRNVGDVATAAFLSLPAATRGDPGSSALCPAQRSVTVSSSRWQRRATSRSGGLWDRVALLSSTFSVGKCPGDGLRRHGANSWPSVPSALRSATVSVEAVPRESSRRRVGERASVHGRPSHGSAESHGDVSHPHLVPPTQQKCGRKAAPDTVPQRPL